MSFEMYNSNKATSDNSNSIDYTTSIESPPKYKQYTEKNYKKIPQVIENFSDEELFDMDVVAHVLPFKTNNYVVNELIDWSNVRKDPAFVLTFPQKDMLSEKHFNMMAKALKESDDKQHIKDVANEIRMQLNPHPAGQKDYNVPVMDNKIVPGSQHKYNETILFFPNQSQTCHAYCTFCFRWPQFVVPDLKFATKDIDAIIDYIKEHVEITDLLFTGGDPMVMSPKIFAKYIDKILEANIPHLKTIRIGTKSLTYWPYTFIEPGGEIILDAFKKVVDSGIHLSFMAHFNHPNEMKTEALKEASKRILATGANIRTQAPLFNHINANSRVWAEMWKMQVQMGMIPYYMFIARDTGAQHFFKVPLEKAWEIFRNAYQDIPGTARTVRGPVMSCGPGKVQILGVSEVAGQKVFTCRFIQARNPNWVHRPFFAKYDPEAIWLDDLKPAFEDKFFFEDELDDIYNEKKELVEAAED